LPKAGARGAGVVGQMPDLSSLYCQRRRTKGWRKPEGSIDCTRPGPRGNPFKVSKAPWEAPEVAARRSVELYRAWLWRRHNGPPSPLNNAPTRAEVEALRGKVLLCYCKPGAPCHVQDVLLPMANA
jgi:hypothetical protein